MRPGRHLTVVAMRSHCCATLLLGWVAWHNLLVPSKGIDEWKILGALETLDRCEQRAETAASTSLRTLRGQNDGVLYARIGASIEATYPDGVKASVRFVCFPDTTDPRRAKRK
jgi:hypothetical protein